jgi:carbon storage regulator
MTQERDVHNDTRYREGSAMLVLSRKPGERILIGDNVAVTIVRIGPNTVRLGIDAPRDMNIVREELCQRSDALSGLTAAHEPLQVVACEH